MKPHATSFVPSFICLCEFWSYPEWPIRLGCGTVCERQYARRQTSVNIWRSVVTGLVVSGSLLLVACGSDHGGGVTAPSSVTAPAVSAATTNRIVAFDHGGGDGDEVEGEAPVTSLVAGTSCPTLSFM